MLLVRGLIAKGRPLLWATGGTQGGWGCQVLQTPFLSSCPANLLREQEFFISSVALSVQHRSTCLSAHLLSHLLVFSRVLVATLHPRRCGVSLAPPSGCRCATPPTFRRVSVLHLPLQGVSAQEVSVLSEPLDVPVFLTQDGDLVLEQDGVQPHLGVHQRHAAKPAGELVHAGLPLGEVVRISPAGRSRRLVGAKEGRISD